MVLISYFVATTAVVSGAAIGATAAVAIGLGKKSR